ncbi:hypothetical protein [Sphingomonas sp. PP-CE-1G-424]|uniref:hypothetical protein n=1 Tax=Sphingomonas sp. PP-CE-1G-424 TaxID=2135658 RepID=UPI001054BB0B|nr:hypothetical protein [Sphingomonas sp. PP-CE-1G-424]TCP72953.1 hypothetical protein C8J43_101696 [Sphingomonas sp. PP-CE-1G-424]
MATTIDAFPARTTVQRNWSTSMNQELANKLLAGLFLMFAFRDTLTAVLRWALALTHLSPLWFIPDLLSIGAFGYFAWHIAFRDRSPFAILLVLNTITAAMVGYIFMSESPFALISSLKLFFPFYVGLALCGSDITQYKFVRYMMIGLMIASIVGLIAAPYFDYPWTGAEFENFGNSKEVGRVWWIDGVVRYGGLAGDSTMAAYMVVFPYLMLFHRIPKWLNLALWPVIYWAIHISTSRSAMLVAVCFALYYLATEILMPSLKKYDIERNLAKWSFLCVPIPFVLIAVLGGVDLSEMSSSLFSLQDRINNSWQLPFTYLSDLFPAGLFVGCGLGCFSYPMAYTDMSGYTVPVDNFYLSTYLMMGVPWLVFMVGMAIAPFRTKIRSKLVMIFILNIYTITVQCYGPSFATISIGYAFSDMFLRGKPWQRRARRSAETDADAAVST